MRQLLIKLLTETWTDFRWLEIVNLTWSASDQRSIHSQVFIIWPLTHSLQSLLENVIRISLICIKLDQSFENCNGLNRTSPSSSLSSVHGLARLFLAHETTTRRGGGCDFSKGHIRLFCMLLLTWMHNCRQTDRTRPGQARRVHSYKIRYTWI